MSPDTVNQRALSESGTLRNDPYQLRPEDIAEPPKSIVGILRKTGPGIILAASIVGTGELIATTRLGALEGYAALWIILLSCFIKPIIPGRVGAIHDCKRRNRA